jgi:hypothetical protein
MKAIIITLLLLYTLQAGAQELYPSSEPASNMASKSIGLRLNNKIYPPYNYRINPEVMFGITKKWMFHFNLFASNIHQNDLRFEGAGVYLKYRLLSFDDVQSHFRLALYGKASLINNPIQYSEVDLSGDNSGMTTGFIATQLLHKLALSASTGYIRGMDNLHDKIIDGQTKQMINYSFSAGYLFLPFHYESYDQPNLNLYIEFLGKLNPDKNESYMDIAPALQLILNSIIRIDLVYQTPLYGNMNRINTREFLLRFEYNFFNVYK